MGRGYSFKSQHFKRHFSDPSPPKKRPHDHTEVNFFCLFTEDYIFPGNQKKGHRLLEIHHRLLVLLRSERWGWKILWTKPMAGDSFAPEGGVVVHLSKTLCDWGSDEGGARDDVLMYFPSKLRSVSEPQNAQNHRVAWCKWLDGVFFSPSPTPWVWRFLFMSTWCCFVFNS